MKWSWKVGRIAGIDVFIHVTFALLLLWIIVANYTRTGVVADGLRAGVFTCTVFLCVLLHEYGHALTARKFGIRTRDITLLPIGGIARLERMPDDPKQELAVAIAGPLVNVAIAAVLFGWIKMTHAAGSAPVDQATFVRGSFTIQLFAVNIALVVFNMIPAFPMDGGRVLRALLAMRLNYARATRIAAALGQAIALVFGFWGLFHSPLLVFIALVIWMGAAQESGFAQIRHALHGIPVRHAMITDFKTLDAADPLQRAVDLLLAGSQHDFPVLQNGQVAGILTRRDLLLQLAKHDRSFAVGDVMQPVPATVSTYDPLEDILPRLNETGAQLLPVVDNGKLVGILTPENISEYLMIQAAAHASPAQGAQRRGTVV